MGGGLGSGAEVQEAADRAGLSEKRAKDRNSTGPPGRGTRAGDGAGTLWGGDKVKVNLPVAFVKMAAEMGLEVPGLSNNDAIKGMDLNTIISMIESGTIGKIVEVESAAGDIVEIMVE